MFTDTWAQPSAAGNKVYVACNKSDEILEIDGRSWSVTRRFPTGRAPYNLAVTPDGKLLVATLKPASGVQVFDLTTGRSMMQQKTSSTLAHGVTVSSDSRYASVSVEGKGAQPGKVEVFDLAAFANVATVDVGSKPAASRSGRWRPRNSETGDLSRKALGKHTVRYIVSSSLGTPPRRALCFSSGSERANRPLEALLEAL